VSKLDTTAHFLYSPRMTDFEEKYPTISKLLVEAIVPPPKSGTVFDTLKKYRMSNGRQIYRKGNGKQTLYFVWDAMHGHWEIYSRKRVNFASVSNEDVVLEEFSSKDDRKKLDL